MHPRLKKFFDFILGEPYPAPVKPKAKTASPPQNTPVVNNQSGEFFKEFLMQIYPCIKPFDVVVIHTKPKTRMGTYNPRTRRIRINDGWGDTEHCKETAIHEYAHHIHFTEKNKTRRKEEPHGKQFWQIYGQLMYLARQKGLYDHYDVLGRESADPTGNSGQ